jgi:predicted permease
MSILRRITNLFSRTKVSAEIDAELRSHIAMRIEDNLASGMTPKEARRDALVRFGNLSVTRERVAGADTALGLESLWSDIRYAQRQLLGAPGFTFACAATLALGIGANTAVFSLLDAVLLHPLPYRDPARLMLVTEVEPKLGLDEFGVAIQEARDYEARSRSFAQMGIFESAGFNLTGDGLPLRVNAALVSPSVFPLLGVTPVIGRGFAPEEDRVGANPVAEISWQLWQSQYGADRNILGRAVKLDERTYTIIGVMPPSFRFPFDGKPLSETADLWVPDVIARERLDPQNRLMEFGVGLIGRLKPGVTEAQAQTEIKRIAQSFEREHADVYSGTLSVEPHTYAFAGYSMRKARPLVVLLMAAVACVLLIACANVANLLLERAGHRAREMAVRAALGASRLRLLRQCLVESLVLAALGATLGIGFAEAVLQGLRNWGPQSLPQLHDAVINPLALAFTLVLTAGASLLFGMLPALRMSHVSPQTALKSGQQIGTGRAVQRMQNLVAIAEIALAAVLLTGGGLLLHSFARLLDTPLGFEPKGTMVARTMFDRARYPEQGRRIAAQRELLSRMAQLPGITKVAAASHLPFSDERQIGVRMEHAPADEFHWAANSLVSPGYFQAMGISLLRGRDFSDDDLPGSLPVAIVSEAFARQYLPGVDAIGQRFQWGDRALFTIVGVVADVHIAALDADPPPMVYNSMFQVDSGATGRTAFVLRGGQGQSVPAVGLLQVLASTDQGLPLYGVTRMSELIDATLAQRRFTILLLAGFAASAAFLAMSGLFGVLSYLVQQREREIGVRMALGAGRAAILKMILRKGLVLGGCGCIAGILLSMLATPLLRANLYHVSRFDPWTLGVVLCLLMGVTLLAVLVPAKRAVSIDPMQALRSE